MSPALIQMQAISDTLQTVHAVTPKVKQAIRKWRQEMDHNFATLSVYYNHINFIFAAEPFITKVQNNLK